MNNTMTRESFCQKVEQMWRANNCKGIVLGGTGVGKTRLIVNACIDKLTREPMAKIVLGSPTTRLRDITIKAEFEKWGATNLWYRLRSACYQTLRSETGSYYDLVIFDEVDKALTPEHFKFLLNNKYKEFLGLSATLEGREKQQMAESIAPVIYRYSTVEAANDGLINKSMNIAVYYNLDTVNKTVPITFKKGGKEMTFYKTEKESYDYYNEIFTENKLKLANLGYTTLGANVYQFLKQKDLSAEALKLLRKYEYGMRKRKDLLLRLPSAATMTKSLISSLQDKQKREKLETFIGYELPEQPKILVFAEFTEFIDSICSHTVHSNKSDKKKENDLINQQTVADFNNNKITVLGSCQSLNVGENLVGANVSIFPSYYSSETNSQQRTGRSTRLPIDELAFNFYLVAKNTQMVKWFDSMTGHLNKDEFITLNYK